MSLDSNILSTPFLYADIALLFIYLRIYYLEKTWIGDMSKELINCWEYKKCGRENGGNKIHELGECPASKDPSYDKFNRGKNGGRICWAIAGTFCGGFTQGTYAEKRLSCLSCDFYHLVRESEGISFKLLKPGQEYKRSGSKRLSTSL